MPSIRCTIVRGGTSRALFLDDADINSFFCLHGINHDKHSVEKLIKLIMGSQDSTRVDGVGGTQSHTSKAAVICKSERPSVDVEFAFYQIGVETDTISTEGTCGNIIAAVGVYALREGMVSRTSIKDEYASVTIFDVNTSSIIEQRVPLFGGIYDDRLDSPKFFQMPGITYGTGEVITDYSAGVGSKTGRLFPTGSPTNTIETSIGSVRVTVCDAANTCVFVHHSELEKASVKIEDNDPQFLSIIRELRGKAAMLAGLLEDWKQVDMVMPAVPLLVFILNDRPLTQVITRSVSMNRLHKSIPGSVAICVAAAASSPGTVVSDYYLSMDTKHVDISHPQGEIQISVTKGNLPDCPFSELSLARHARIIMQGEAYINDELITQHQPNRVMAKL